MMDLRRIERALIVDTPWILHILDDQPGWSGRKTWEMRSRATKVRGPIGLIQSRTGTIVGVTEVSGCEGPLAPETMLANVGRHRIPDDMIRSGAVAKWNHAWVLSGSARLAKPIPYKHPQGAVIWVTLDHDTRAVLTGATTLP